MAVTTVTSQSLPATNIICGRSKLTAGAVSVSVPQITDSSLVFLSGDDANVDGALQAVITTGVGFAVASSTGGDAGYVAWLCVLTQA